MIEEKKKILIVDDVEDVREALAMILEDEGYQVSTAENGVVAKKQLENESVDLVISDILMPDMDGVELVTHIKKQYPDMKILLISGGGRQVASESDFDYLSVTSKLTGVTSVLKKPIKPAELIQTIAELI